jgi:6-phosphogluconolactonase
MSSELSRRDFLALTGAGLVGAAAGSTPQPYPPQSSKKLYAYVGSWTRGGLSGTGGGGGIRVFTVDMSDGSLTLVSQTGPEQDDLNAGNVCISPDGRFLYAVNEIANLNGKVGAGGGVLAFAINQQNGSLTFLNGQQSMGVHPCWLAIDQTGSRLLVANHGNNAILRVVKKNGVPEIENLFDDGTVSMYPLKPDGRMEPACDVAILERTHGVVPNAQASAHAHSVNFDPSHRFAIACDTGADRIYVYQITPGSRTFGAAKPFSTAPGKAPRHSAFHPRLPYFFVTNEQESSLSSFHFDSRTGEVRPIQTARTVPADYSGPRNSPADVRVHPNGKFVYGSNRGHDSIAIFKIDEATGNMTPVDIVKVLGANPGEFNFEPSGKFLFVANVVTDNVVTFAVDPDSGKMTPTGAKIDVPKPQCVHFVML